MNDNVTFGAVYQFWDHQTERAHVRGEVPKPGNVLYRTSEPESTHPHQRWATICKRANQRSRCYTFQRGGQHFASSGEQPFSASCNNPTAKVTNTSCGQPCTNRQPHRQQIAPSSSCASRALGLGHKRNKKRQYRSQQRIEGNNYVASQRETLSRRGRRMLWPEMMAILRHIMT